MQLLSYWFSLWPYFFGGLAILLFGIKWGWEAQKVEAGRKRMQVISQFKSFGSELAIPEHTQIVDGKRYSTLDSKCLGSSRSLFGQSWLFKTNNKNYFVVMSNPLGGIEGMSPVDSATAMQLFSGAQKREVTFEDAFPDIKVIDA